MGFEMNTSFPFFNKSTDFIPNVLKTGKWYRAINIQTRHRDKNVGFDFTIFLILIPFWKNIEGWLIFSSMAVLSAEWSCCKITIQSAGIVDQFTQIWKIFNCLPTPNIYKCHEDTVWQWNILLWVLKIKTILKFLSINYPKQKQYYSLNQTNKKNYNFFLKCLSMQQRIKVIWQTLINLCVNSGIKDFCKFSNKSYDSISLSLSGI